MSNSVYLSGPSLLSSSAAAAASPVGRVSTHSRGYVPSSFIRYSDSSTPQGFASCQSMDPVNAADLYRKINEIDLNVQALLRTLRAAQNSVWFGREQVGAFDQQLNSLVAMNTPLLVAQDTLAARKKEVSVINETEYLEPILRQIQTLEVDLEKIEQERRNLKERLELRGYRQLKESICEIEKECNRQIISQEPIDFRLVALERIWEEKLNPLLKEVSSNPAILKAKIDIVRLFLPSLKSLHDANLLQNDGDDKAKITTRVQALQSSCTNAFVQLQKAMSEDSLIARGSILPQATYALAESSSDLAGSFAYTPAGSGITGWWYKNYYKATDEFGNRLQEIAGKIVALQKNVCFRIQCISQANFSVKEGHDTFQGEFNSYVNRVKTCKNKIDEQLKELSAVPATDQTTQVIRYATGLEETLDEITRSLKFIERLDSDQFRKVAVGQNHLMRFLSPKLQSNSVYHLYEAATSLQPLIQERQTFDENPDFFKGFVGKNLDVLVETVARKAPVGLVLSELEEDVWGVLFGRRTLEQLRLSDEDRQCLPHVVRSRLQKQITDFLYFPQDVDRTDNLIEVELLLSVLKTDYSPLLVQTRAVDRSFDAILTAYEGSNTRREYRISDEILKKASDVCSLVENALSGHRNILNSAKAWQAFYEFEVFRRGKEKEIPVAASERVIQFLFLQVKNMSKDQQFYQPSEEALKDDIDVIVRMPDLSKIIGCYEVEKRRGVFFRALACGMYAKDLRVAKDAQKIVHTYLECDDSFFQELLEGAAEGFTFDEYKPDFIEMINEHTLLQIAENKLGDLSERALMHLIDGPFKMYLNSKAFPMPDPRISPAMAVVLQYEKTQQKAKKPLTELAEATIGKQRCEELLHWMDRFDTAKL